jgi:iron(III) transport system substrate-binding protein
MRKIKLIIALFVPLLAADIWTLWPHSGDGLVIYSAMSNTVAVARAFTQQTGIPVQVIDSSTGSLLARVSAEGRTPRWDLIWFEGDTAAAALDSAGLLARHTTPDLDWTPIGRSLLPADGAYTPTTVTLSAIFVYARDRVPTPPVHWPDLLATPSGLGICMNDPTRSGPAYALVSGMLDQGGGWPAGQHLLHEMRDAGLRPCEPGAMMALLDGEAGMALLQSGQAVQFVKQHKQFAYSIPQPAFVLPSVIGIASRIPPKRLESAEAFIRFALSRQALALRMAGGSGDSVFWPVVSDAPAPSPLLPPLSSVSVAPVNPYDWGRLEAPVLDWYDQAFEGQ